MLEIEYNFDFQYSALYTALNYQYRKVSHSFIHYSSVISYILIFMSNYIQQSRKQVLLYHSPAPHPSPHLTPYEGFFPFLDFREIQMVIWR